MGRTTIYRTDVEKARNALISRGINPSLDAIRIELGNTGSKSTIHKFLRDIEGEEAADGNQEKQLGNEIGDLVAKLAARLKQEADERVAEIRAAADAQLAASAEALSREKAETQRLSGLVDRLEAGLGDERAAHAETRDLLQRATVTIGQLQERGTGLEQRIAEHESHARSLEAKHQQAREALEHFRASVKEQREQDLRRHEHQVQGLQVELRQAQDAITEKNQDLVRLNRDNVQLTEQVGQLTRELQRVESERRDSERRLSDVQPQLAEHRVLRARSSEDARTIESQRMELASIKAELAREREDRRAAEAAMRQATERFGSLEQVLRSANAVPAPSPPT